MIELRPIEMMTPPEGFRTWPGKHFASLEERTKGWPVIMLSGHGTQHRYAIYASPWWLLTTAFRMIVARCVSKCLILLGYVNSHIRKTQSD